MLTQSEGGSEINPIFSILVQIIKLRSEPEIDVIEEFDIFEIFLLIVRKMSIRCRSFVKTVRIQVIQSETDILQNKIIGNQFSCQVSPRYNAIF